MKPNAKLNVVAVAYQNTTRILQSKSLLEVNIQFPTTVALHVCNSSMFPRNLYYARPTRIHLSIRVKVVLKKRTKLEVRINLLPLPRNC